MLNGVVGNGARTAVRVLAVVAVTVIITVVFDQVRSVNPIDWVVYRYGSAGAWRGEDIYAAGLRGALIGQPDGMPFTYPPFAAIVLWPTNLFGMTLGATVWTALSVLLVLALVHLSVPANVARRDLMVAIAWIAACATTVVSIHLSFGQINLLLAVLVVADIGRSDRVLPFLPRGVLVGLAAAIKLTPLVFFAYLAGTRQWRTLGVATVTFGGAAAVAFAIAPRMSSTFWTDSLWHLDSTVALGAGLGTPSNSSLTGLFVTIGLPGAVATAILGIVAVLGAWAALRVYRIRGHLAGVVVAGIVGCLISPVSWIHHWVFLIPAAILVAADRRWAARGAVVTATVVAIVTWPRAGDRLLDGHDVWLHPLGWAIREMLIGMGIAAVVALLYPPRQTAAEESAASSSRTRGSTLAPKYSISSWK